MVHYWVVEKATGYGRWRCRRCSGEAVLKRKTFVRRLLILEAGDRCQACGYDRCRKNFHFHHLDPADKKFNLTAGNGKSLARFREEARKCVLVCANCHGEIENGLRPAPPSMEQRTRVFRTQSVTMEQVARGLLVR
jgi:cytochrome c553